MNPNMSMHLFHIILATMMALTLIQSKSRKNTTSRNSSDVVIDGVSLLVHFFLIPAAVFWTIGWLKMGVASEYMGVFKLPKFLTAVGGLILVDYFWYWNHRLFHADTWLWNLHQVHHNAKVFDVFMSARNTIWSPLLMVYMWAAVAASILLEDPSWFVVGSAFGLAVNFWGHTSFGPKAGGRLHQWMSSAFITPHEHSWHHSSESNNHNFATVFSFWDKLHGTYYSPKSAPEAHGFDPEISTLQQLCFPFK